MSFGDPDGLFAAPNSVRAACGHHILTVMSSDPFNFGSPAHEPPPPPGAPPGGQQGNPFAGSVPNNPLSAPGASRPSSAVSAGSGTQAPPFGGPAPAATLVAAQPPTWLLFLAGGLAIVAAVVAIVVDLPVVAIICWVAAGPVAIGLLALFVKRDTFARSSGLYAARDWVKPLHYVAVGVCLLCILAPALRLADWVGHL